MATRVEAVGEVIGIEEMERRLVELVEQVEREKEKTRYTFQQLHSLLVVREEALLRELDGVVVDTKQELKNKREVLQELQVFKESAERELTKNKLKSLLEKNLQNIEDQIRGELSKPLNVTWIEVEWKRERLEHSIVELSKVMNMKERSFRLEPESSSLNLSNPGLSLFPLKQRGHLASSADQAEFSSETLQEQNENKYELESRYRQEQLECEMLQQQVAALEIKQGKTEIVSEGLDKLSGVLCPEGVWDRVEDQIKDLVQAATKLAVEFQPDVMYTLKTENDKLKEECRRLDAVVKMYTEQLTLYNQQWAVTSGKMSQLSKENEFLKSYDSLVPRRHSYEPPSYPPRSNPKHVMCIDRPSTESIKLTEPASRTSSSSFTTIDFLKNASIHPVTVLCPICGVKFGRETNVVRTKHVNECIKRTSM